MMNELIPAPKVGVVIGRFQVPSLTLGHCSLLARAAEHERVLILVGVHGGQPTDRNPLSFDARKAMILSLCPGAEVLPVYDMGDDEYWSAQVDSLIGDCNAVLYAGRDSFSEQYTGKHPVQFIPSIHGCNGTSTRESIAPVNCPSFRAGMIKAQYDRFPTAYMTVDIALIYDGTVLLGQKTGETKWRFPGGFVDPTDSDLVSAAKRELAEETGQYDTHEWRYVTSKRIPDRRYAGSRDSIMTALFATTFAWGRQPKAGDDLERISYFAPEELSRVITPQHSELIPALLEHLHV